MKHNASPTAILHACVFHARGGAFSYHALLIINHNQKPAGNILPVYMDTEI